MRSTGSEGGRPATTVRAQSAKGAKSEASRKAPADAQKWLTEGCQAEVQMQDGGMVGSRYPVRVMQLSSDGGTRRAEVLFDGLYAEVDGKADADDGAGADAKADADDGAGADAKANIDADFSPELIDEKLWEGAGGVCASGAGRASTITSRPPVSASAASAARRMRPGSNVSSRSH